MAGEQKYDHESLEALCNDLVDAFDKLSGHPKGARPAHAKGIMCSGKFIPSPDAKHLTNAEHVQQAEVPVVLRFSNSSGLPAVGDNDAQKANPKGIAVRFNLGEHDHTDVIAHSANGFPTRTGGEFLEMLDAIIASADTSKSPPPIVEFLGSHPAAARFVNMPKPTPASFAQEQYFGVTAMRFTNAMGENSYGRFRILPEAGIKHLTDEENAAKDGNFLEDELTKRLTDGQIKLNIKVQVAGPEDNPDDATNIWPEDRKMVDFGQVILDKIVDAGEEKFAKIIFDPIPRINGIQPSADPLLELRAAIYLITGRRRRAENANAQHAQPNR